jgi:hypothetical protein
MELEDDLEVYESGVQAFNRELVRQLDAIYLENGISDPLDRSSLTEDILFAVGTLLDGAPVPEGAPDLEMFAGFRKDQKWIYTDSGLSFHDGASDYADEFYDDDAED